MKPHDRRLIGITVILLALLSAAFAMLIFLPERAHWLLPIIAIPLLLYGLVPLLRHRAQQRCLGATAVVQRVVEHEDEVVVSGATRPKYYYPEIDYEYRRDGRTCNGDVVADERENVWVAATDPHGAPTPKAARWWLALRAGDEIPVYLNPRKPRDAVLVRSIDGAPRSHHLALIVAGALLLLLWLVVAG